MNSHSDLLDERRGMPSASGVEGLFLCNGKFNAEKGLVDIEFSASREGTIRHSLAEMDMPVDQIEDRERARAIEVSNKCVDEIRSSTLGADGHKMKEQRLWLRDSKGVPFLSGKPDYVELLPKSALIVDYKMLYGEHSPAHENAQLFTLASMIMQEHEKVEECFVALVTPMLDPPFSVSSLKRPLVKKWAQQLFKLNTDIQKPDAKRVAGPKQCKYCRALPFCPEARELLDGLMNKDIKEIASDPEELRKAHALAGTYETFATRIKALVRKTLTEDPNSVAGLKLGKGMALASYKTENAMKVLIDRKFNIEELHKFVSIKERALIKEWAEKTGESMAQAKKSLREIMKAGDALDERVGAQRILKQKQEKKD
jgi:hypothetical protein